MCATNGEYLCFFFSTFVGEHFRSKTFTAFSTGVCQRDQTKHGFENGRVFEAHRAATATRLGVLHVDIADAGYRHLGVHGYNPMRMAKWVTSPSAWRQDSPLAVILRLGPDDRADG